MMEEQDKWMAWCEWKKWCSILRVKNPCPMEDELAAGLSDDIDAAKRKEMHQYLKKRLKYAAENKYNDEVVIFDMDDFASVFDDRMKRKTQNGFGPYKAAEATHKDYLFYLVGQSSDPALKVINGVIFRRFYLRDTIKEYLSRYASTYIPAGTKTIAPLDSLDAPVKDDLSGTQESLYDMIYDETGDIAEYDFTIREEATRICKLLDRREKIMLLVMYHNKLVNSDSRKINLEDPDLNEFAGVKRAGCSEASISMMNKIRQECANIGLDKYGGEIILSTIKKIILDFQTEKTGSRFLDKVLCKNLSLEKEN